MEGYSRKRRQIERERQANRWIKEIKVEIYKKKKSNNTSRERDKKKDR